MPHPQMPSNIENTTAVDKNKSEGLPLPEAGLKPLNYREQFSVRLELFLYFKCLTPCFLYYRENKLLLISLSSSWFENLPWDVCNAVPVLAPRRPRHQWIVWIGIITRKTLVEIISRRIEIARRLGWVYGTFSLMQTCQWWPAQLQQRKDDRSAGRPTKWCLVIVRLHIHSLALCKCHNCPYHRDYGLHVRLRIGGDIMVTYKCKLGDSQCKLADIFIYHESWNKSKSQKIRALAPKSSTWIEDRFHKNFVICNKSSRPSSTSLMVVDIPCVCSWLSSRTARAPDSFCLCRSLASLWRQPSI